MGYHPLVYQRPFCITQTSKNAHGPWIAFLRTFKHGNEFADLFSFSVGHRKCCCNEGYSGIVDRDLSSNQASRSSNASIRCTHPSLNLAQMDTFERLKIHCSKFCCSICQTEILNESSAL